MTPGLLTESGWKTIVTRCHIRDNGLQRALAAYERLDDEDHDERLEAVTSIIQLAGALKRAREVAAVPQAVRYLTDLLAAAEAEKRDIAKARTEAARRAQTAEHDEEDDEADGAYHEKLLAAFLRLKGSRSLSYQFVVCDARPFCGLMVAKRITPQHKEELTKLTGGSRRFLPLGTCQCDGTRYSFSVERSVPGLARKLQDSVRHFTGKRFAILVGGESAEEEVGAPADGTVPEPNAVPQSARQTGPQATPSPASRPAPGTRSGAAAPEASPTRESSGGSQVTLANAPQFWTQAMRMIGARIEQLKAAIRREFAQDDPGLLTEIEGSISSLDQAISGLDGRLADSFDRARSAQNPAARANELTRARGILVEYINFVKSEPLIAEIDANPFGVQVNLKRTLSALLAQMAQVIGRVGPAAQH